MYQDEIYKCMRAYACVWMYAHACVWMHTCVCVCMHARVYEHSAACACVCMRAYICVCMHACMYILHPQVFASLATPPPSSNIEKLHTPMIRTVIVDIGLV